MKKYRNITIMIFIIIFFNQKYLLSLYSINPYEFINGSAGIYKYDITSTLNPASIGLSEYPYLIQSIPITSDKTSIIYSQELKLPLDKYNHMAIGFSLVNRNVKIQNTSLSIKYSLRLFDSLYTGIKAEFRQHNKTKTSIGILMPLRIGDFIKYINFSFLGINSKLDKLSLKLPNKNYGEYVVFGIATSLILSRNTDLIFTYDRDIIRNNIILGNKSKIQKAGIQLKLKRRGLNLRVMASKEILYKYEYADNFGIEFQKGPIIITFGSRFSYLNRTQVRYFSLTLLGDKRNTVDINSDEKDIEISINLITSKKVVFNFKGKKENISYYKFIIMDDKGKQIKIFSNLKKLPDELIWNIKQNIQKGVYKCKLIYIKNGIDYRIFKREKEFALL